MEGFEYIMSKSNIEGININTLEKLLQNATCNQYSIKKIINSSIIAFDSNKGKICMINCVKNYYNLPDSTECVSTQKCLFGEFKDCSCDKCHLKAIELWKQQKIEKK